MIAVFLKVIIPVLIILSLGFVVGKYTDIQSKTLSTLALYLLSPALMFQAIYSYENIFTPDTLKIFLAITIITLAIIVVVELLGKLFKIPKSTRIVLILTLMLSNTGNFGLPVNQYAYGDEGFLVASIVMVIYSIYTYTVGIFVAASDKSEKREAMLTVLKLPLFYVILLGLVLSFLHVKLPPQVFKPLQSMGLAAIPVNLIQLGVNLSRMDIRRVRAHLPFVLIASASKLVVIPFAAYFLLGALGLGGIVFKATLTQIAMPSAVYSSILASHYDSDTELTSSIVMVTTILSLFSLSFLIAYVTGGAL